MSRDVVAPASSARPIAIGLLLGVSGWFAGVFVLLLVGILFRPEGVGAAAVCGAILLAAAWGLFMAGRDDEQVFVAQLALALSIAGQCLVLYAATRHVQRGAPIAGAALVLEVVLAMSMPNRLHRTLSTLFATVAWALLLHFVLVDDLAGGPPSLDSQALALGGWFLAWGPVGAALGWALRDERIAAAGDAGGWTPILVGLVGGLAFATLASCPFEALHGFAGERGADVLALWPLLSALGALAATAAAFALRRRGLMAWCVVATLLHVGHFYYALGCSLRVKSLLMGAFGATLLLAARGLRSKEAA